MFASFAHLFCFYHFFTSDSEKTPPLATASSSHATATATSSLEIKMLSNLKSQWTRISFMRIQKLKSQFWFQYNGKNSFVLIFLSKLILTLKSLNWHLCRLGCRQVDSIYSKLSAELARRSYSCCKKDILGCRKSKEGEEQDSRPEFVFKWFHYFFLIFK